MNHMRGSFHAEQKLTEAREYKALVWRVYEEQDPRLGTIARIDGTDNWTDHVPELLSRLESGQTIVHTPSKRQLSKADCLLSTQLDILIGRALTSELEDVEKLTQVAVTPP